MKVSVVMPVFNNADYLPAAINSVIAQTHSDWELICVDDASNDQSVKVIKKFTIKEPRIHLIKLENNSGAAIARNTGIDASTGDYIAFLDADDYWLPEKLSKQLEAAKKSNSPIVSTAYQAFDEESPSRFIITPPKKITYSDMLKTSSIGCSTAMFSRDFLGKERMPDIRKRQDYAFWLNLLQRTPFAVGVQEVLCHYRLTPNSLSRNKFKVLSYQWEVYRKHAKLSFPKAMYYFVNYVIRGLLKRA